MMILLLKRTNFGFKPKTGINFGGGFKHNITSTKTKFFQGIGIKRFNSYSNNDDVNTAATEISVEDENYNNVNNIKNNILISGIEQSEWNKEFKRVENILEIPEAPEIFE